MVKIGQLWVKNVKQGQNRKKKKKFVAAAEGRTSRVSDGRPPIVSTWIISVPRGRTSRVSRRASSSAYEVKKSSLLREDGRPGFPDGRPP